MNNYQKVKRRMWLTCFEEIFVPFSSNNLNLITSIALCMVGDYCRWISILDTLSSAVGNDLDWVPDFQKQHIIRKTLDQESAELIPLVLLVIMAVILRCPGVCAHWSMLWVKSGQVCIPGGHHFTVELASRDMAYSMYMGRAESWWKPSHVQISFKLHQVYFIIFCWPVLSSFIPLTLRSLYTKLFHAFSL
jgi:hypothetical protein